MFWWFCCLLGNLRTQEFLVWLDALIFVFSSLLHLISTYFLFRQYSSILCHSPLILGTLIFLPPENNLPLFHEDPSSYTKYVEILPMIKRGIWKPSLVTVDWLIDWLMDGWIVFRAYLTVHEAKTASSLFTRVTPDSSWGAICNPGDWKEDQPHARQLP